MRVGDKSCTNWNKSPLRLWQSQLNFAVFYASSASGVISEHLNYKRHPMWSLYRFHVLILPREKDFEKITGSIAA